MSKYQEQLCDKLVQQIACTAPSAWSGKPAECGHHIIHRANLLWRWRLLNIVPLTIEEHTMQHAGLLDALEPWQKVFEFDNRNKLLYGYLPQRGITRDEFVTESLNYLRQVKSDIDKGKITFAEIVEKERSKYGEV